MLSEWAFKDFGGNFVGNFAITNRLFLLKNDHFLKKAVKLGRRKFGCVHFQVQFF